MYLQELINYLHMKHYHIKRLRGRPNEHTNGFDTDDQEMVLDPNDQIVAYIDETQAKQLLVIDHLDHAVRKHLEQYAAQPIASRLLTDHYVISLPKHDLNVLRRMNLKFNQPNGTNRLDLNRDEICMLHHLTRELKRIKNQ